MSRIKIIVLVLALCCATVLLFNVANALAAPDYPEHVSEDVLGPGAQGCNGTPTIQYAYANPPTIAPGQVTTLYWGLVANANAAYLRFPNGNQSGIATPGSQQVNPTQTSTYFVVGVCGGNQAQIPIQVTVQGQPTCNGTPVLQGFSANPSTINNGQTSTLSWGQVLNADSVQLSSQFNGGSGVPTPGQAPVTPNQTTTYYLTAWCQGSTAQAQVTITVNHSTPPTPTPPPQQANQVRQVQVETAPQNQRKVTVNYYWNGEDAPAVITSTGYNGSKQAMTNSPSTGIIAGYVKYVIQYLNVNLGAGTLSTVTSCIVGKSGTDLACLTVPAQ